MNRAEFFEKVDYEGGLYECLVCYGLDPDEIEDAELRPLVKDYLEQARPLNALRAQIYRLEGEEVT